jgi:hypothetical protein
MNYKFHGTTRLLDPYSGSQRFTLTHIACFSSVPPGKCRHGNLNYVTTNSFCILLNSRFTIHRVTQRYTQKSFPCPQHEIHGRRRGMDPLILKLGNRREWQLHTPTALLPERTLVHNKKEAGWVREPVWANAWSIKKISCPYQHSDPGPSSQ